MPNITLPPRDGQGSQEILSDLSSLVIVGPNGSGKSKLGYWIETNQTGAEVHRVSAQRALTFSDIIQPYQYERAEAQFLYGHEHLGRGNEIRSRRWGSRPTAGLLNDFDKLLVLLFAGEAKRNKEYTKQAKETEEYHCVPESRIDVLLGIWHHCLPQRELTLRDGKVQASIEGSGTYDGSEMSDGERVGLYLIGQCLSAQKNSLIVIDEPEIHLHRAIQTALWDRIETARPDCLFVYITHDLDFAASRTTGRKIYVKEFDGSNWKWEEVPGIDELPENVLLEVLGSRRNILFVEGEKSSLDAEIYRTIYPEHLVVPRGGCSRAIESTKAMRNLPNLHHLRIHGIIDRDYRCDEEVAALKKEGIHCLEVAEIENLICIEEVVRIIAKDQMLDPDDALEQVKDLIISELREEIETQISNQANARIRLASSKFAGKRGCKSEVAAAFKEFVDSIDVDDYYKKSSDLFNRLVSEKNFPGILQHYNRKKLPKRISGILGLRNYPEYVIRKMKSENEEIQKENAKVDSPKKETEQKDTTEQPGQPEEEKQERVVEVLRSYLPKLD